MAVCTQTAHHPVLVRGGELGEDLCALHGFGQRRIVHLFYLAAQQQRLIRQANVAAYLARDTVVVAGQDFHGHAMCAQRCQCRCGAFFWRVQKGDIARQCESGLVRRMIGNRVARHLGWQQLARYRHDPQTIVVEPGRYARNSNQFVRCQRQHGVALLHVRADRHHFLYRTLTDQQWRLPLLCNDHRHAPALKVERHFIDQPPRPGQRQRVMQLRMLQYRNVEQIFQACLKVTVEVGHAKHFIARLAVRVNGELQGNVVLSQRAGLVGTQHIHGAQVLDGIQPFDDDLAA